MEGQFTFTADHPQLHCAVFFIGEPQEIISIEYSSVNIDCNGGDFIKVSDHPPAVHQHWAPEQRMEEMKKDVNRTLHTSRLMVKQQLNSNTIGTNSAPI